MASSESVSVHPEWKKRWTYVTTGGQNTTVRFASVGTVISAERLTAVEVRCPRCDAPAAVIWRRFDYLGRGLPLYFTKCRKCRRRRPIDADEAAFRLLEAGIRDPMEVLHQGIPVPDHSEGSHRGDGGDAGNDGGDVAGAEQLLTNRQRALGKKHPLTFVARAQLGEAVGQSGDAAEAARMYDHLLLDQLAAVGHQSPAVLANRYRAAAWTARAGLPQKALTELRGLLADQERVLGPDHANTLITRATVAQVLADTGDRDEALEMLREVTRDQVRVLGSEHPATEASQGLLAEWEGR